MNDYIELMWVAYLKGKQSTGFQFVNTDHFRKEFEAWVEKDYPTLCKLVFKFPQNVCGKCLETNCVCDGD